MGDEAVDKDVEDLDLGDLQKKKKKKGIVRREVSSVRFRFITLFYF